MFVGQCLHLVVVDQACSLGQSVLDGVLQLARKIHFRTMRQVPAFGEAHAQ